MTRDTFLFERESALVDRLLQLLPKHLESLAGEHVIAVEVGVGRAIADVVAVLWNGSTGQPTTPLTARDSVVLATLRLNGPTRVDLLERRCGLSQGSLRTGALEYLTKNGLLERGPGGRVSLVSTWTSAVRVVAIEAKLTLWRAAIKQARAHLRYADESFVALPDSVAVRASECADEFVEANVGLLGIGDDLDVALRGSASSNHDWRREFAVSRVLSERRRTCT